MQYKKIIDKIKYWGQIILLPIYWLSFITPRSKKIWLFGSTFGRRFADNPKYAYLYMNQYKKEEIRPIWITHNKDVVKLLNDNKLEAYYYHSFKGIFYCLIGKVYIFDNYSKDISFWLSGGATKVNLWHGTATKKINQDNKFDYYRHPRNKWERFHTALRRISDEKPSHYVLATSKNMAKILESAFKTYSSHMLVVGHPRNDILFNKGLKDLYTEAELQIRSELQHYREADKKCIFYTPTFRDSEDIFLKIMNMEQFNRFLMENNYMLFSKLHIKSKLKQEFADIKYSNIRYIDANVDPATILEFADMLIVDYSSIYLDYMMLDRPVVAFPFDYEEYLSNSRECYFEYEEYMPELKVKTMSELMSGIKQVFENDTYKDKRHIRRNYHFEDIDGNSSERLYRAIKKILDNI
ncbi:CDP-glycerol glycerophosphotransferase (TagB/SpsB family) [Lachnotalea glycerini]|uniref:CDP-glycerol glycerophosphotransferase (TagB/SpsB family) n=1 Tax=Lachnotalea glycerini TaxID=1763509 RepID=A0A318EUD0_9FIRM|nr:CDP-glycerol glycerophosphotransferase family protein [Lachnotalea glycerini]PXV91858.1 CDP-glycerol glycerophosphotransferase (TagB/SpsB family) [Lachnotalea glycerini]